MVLKGCVDAYFYIKTLKMDVLQDFIKQQNEQENNVVLTNDHGQISNLT